MFTLRLSSYFRKNIFITKINKSQTSLERKCSSNLTSFLKSSESNFDKEKLAYFDKIIYSEAIQSVRRKLEPSDGPIFLNCISEDTNLESQKELQTEPSITESVYFPFKVKKKYCTKTKSVQTAEDVFSDSITNLTPSDNEKLKNFKNIWKTKSVRTLTKDYEKINILDYNKDDVLENDNIDDNIKFGTCDPESPISCIPCAGCGAFLHCSNPSIPGFLPQEVYKCKEINELRGEICQRCHFLKEFDVALSVNVCPSDYIQIIRQLKNKNALIVVLIDLLDFPCSIYKELFDLIGSNPVVIVGNKVDLLIQEGPLFLKHVKNCLIECLKEEDISLENILHIALISAKTGYGIEKLISSLQQHWGSKGDVYIVGCTNAGKSTLFNILINSDYCKVRAIDLLQKATVSAWPGTTLNLLKFPISKPVGWKVGLRNMRLSKEKKAELELEKLRPKNPRFEQMQLSGHVGRTFPDNKSVNISKDLKFNCSVSSEKKVFDPNSEDFISGKWCYDTPGVVHEDQIINILTTSELLLVVPKKMLIPRIFKVEPGLSLFLGGIARIDILKGSKQAWLSLYASEGLPVTIVKSEDADIFYKKFLGTEILRVPCGGQTRLSKWPEMLSTKLEIVGRVPKEAAGDIVLSSAGWVSVSLPPAHRSIFNVWTPEGRGIYLRKIPIIKETLFFKGNRISKSPAFKTSIKKINF